MNVLFRLTKRKEFDRKCALSDREMISLLYDQPFDVYSHSFKGLFGYIFVLVQSAV